MSTRADELLYHLLWTTDFLIQPTWRNATDSFEAWAYRKGYLDQIHRLEAQRFLEKMRAGTDKRLIRLTESGRIRALGGRDPMAEWKRPWDGIWRAVVYDLPSKNEGLRSRLYRALKSNGFGNLQRSVWITPDPLTRFQKLFRGDNQVKTFICLESKPCGGERDKDIVLGAWKWREIDALYRHHRGVLQALPKLSPSKSPDPDELLEWGRRERTAWKTVIENDPLLPEALLPRGYLGKRVWKERVRVLKCAGELIQAHRKN